MGEPEPGGKWEEFHRRQLGKHPRCDYWHDLHWVFTPKFHRLIRFKIRLAQAGEYPIVLKLAAPSEYDEIERHATIYVEEGEPGLRDRFGPLITSGERLRKELATPLS